ncbi:hypothetical protein GKO32_24375 [Amycolatopsis sp. RM579]|uniref:Uncharacterized protein n=1 Tax=Amycolatopsis pithecellobii TaxID=664692 RepID=A0A6N7YYW5_9PSEU|nr:hypothetical protein [Amycolatopsis pithecellobii]
MPRHLSRIARTTVGAVWGLPRLMTVVTELRDAVKQIERLATFAAQELPEVVYQLEKLRAQLAEIEHRLAVASTSRNGREVSPAERRSGSRRPS